MPNRTARSDLTLRTVVVGLFLAGAASGSDPQRAPRSGVIVVNTATDSRQIDGFCSLREAILAANAQAQLDTCPGGPGFNSIILSAEGPYLLTLGGSGEDLGLEGDLDVYQSISIRPNNGIPRVIDAQGLDRVLHVHESVLVILEQIEIRGGFVVGGGGGGVRVDSNATLTLEDVDIRDNLAEMGAGGGILMLGGELNLTRVVVAENGAGSGGGLDLGGSASLSGIQVSISENRAVDGGAGLRLHSSAESVLVDSAIVDNRPLSLSPELGPLSGGGLQLLAGDLLLENVTVSGNVASRGGGLDLSGTSSATLANVTVTANQATDGGGLFASFGPNPRVVVRNTLIAGNQASDVAPDCFGDLESEGHNLIGSTSLCTLLDCGAGAACGELLDVSPRLTARGMYGGLTPTHLLLDDSPALDAGDPGAPGSGGTACPSVDQRHRPRPADGDDNLLPRCDIGAVEMQAPLLPIFVDGFESGDIARWSTGTP